MSKRIAVVSKALEAATTSMKNTVVNIKETTEVAKTIDPKGASMAIGLAIFGAFMAPHFVAKDPEDLADVNGGPEGPVQKKLKEEDDV